MPRDGRIRKRASRAGPLAAFSDYPAPARSKTMCAFRGIDEPMRHAELRSGPRDGELQKSMNACS
jgi:hypothetical protein